MTERVGTWNAVSGRRVEVPGPAEPPVGRHALDHEAGLTPIFTAMRRGPRRHAGTRALRPVMDPVEQFRHDPLTAPIPVVPALYAVDAPPIDPYVPASFVEPSPPPSPTEATLCWSPGSAPAGGWGGAGWTAHDPHGAPGYDAGYDAHGYGPAAYDAPYDTGHHQGGYGGGYDAGYDRGGYDVGGYDAGYESAGYDPGYGAGGSGAYPADPYSYLRRDPALYDPLTDSGRHHVRLAPAGW